MPVEIVGLTKKFGRVVAVDDVTVTLDRGKISVLLGPSGCGKTTVLRCIAGLEKPDIGEIYASGNLVTSTAKEIFVPPESREIGMVFQSYAIWPHMTVFDNIAYPLKIDKLPRSEIEKRVKETLEIVNLQGLENRYATQLSGGQQQRVALARGIVSRPRVLLLDEPLSNLDAKLRESTRFELEKLQRSLGVTTVYVTHDQAEAMVLSDKIVLMNRGKIMQVGNAYDIYRNPRSRFVSEFIGLTNFVLGKIVEISDNRECLVRSKDGIEIRVRMREDSKLGDDVVVGMRPENLRISRQRPDRGNTWQSKVQRGVFMGDHRDYWVKIEETSIRIQASAETILHQEELAYVQADIEDLYLIAAE